MKLTEKTLEQKYLYHGKIIQVRLDKAELENGAVVGREVVEHPGGVSVAVLTEQNELLFVRQFRYPYGEIVLELPAGKLEKGEDPFEAMKREQKEETGTHRQKLHLPGEPVSHPRLHQRDYPPVGLPGRELGRTGPGRRRVHRGGAHPPGKGRGDGHEQ